MWYRSNTPVPSFYAAMDMQQGDNIARRANEVAGCFEVVIALAVSPHSFPFIRLQHTQLNNDPYLSFLKS
jgi:hypothetical protein